MSSSYDVIVVGLGGMGSSAAYHLAARGQRVLGLERFGPAHHLGSSHGGSRIYRQAYFEDPAYVPLALHADEMWQRLNADSGRRTFTRTGGLMIGPEDSLAFSGSLRSAREWGLEHEVLDAAELRRRFPTFSPGDHDVALYEGKAGVAHPEEAVSAHLELATARGAELRFEEPVTDWRARDSGEVRVTTARGSYTADRLVIAPGAWAPSLLADLGVRVSVQRQVMHWFEPTGGIGPYAPDRHPIYLWEDRDGTQFYGFPAIDGPGGGAKVAFFRADGAATTADTVEREVDPHEVTAMSDYLADRMPTLPGRFLRAAVCMFSNSPDEHFVVGRHPGHERTTVACGFSGHGFKFVPVIGEIIADLVIEGATKHPVDLFDPARPRGTHHSAG